MGLSATAVANGNRQAGTFPPLPVIEIAYALGLFMPPQVLLASPGLGAGSIAQQLWIAGHEPPLFSTEVP